MICNMIDENFYILKIFNDNDNFDIYDHEFIKDFTKELFDNILKKYDIRGDVLFNIYIDNLYGIIIEITSNNDILSEDLVELKIKFNLNISFLYEVDYFYLYENKLTNQNIYFYKDKFYLEIINEINRKDYLELLDNSYVIYDNQINDIVNNGIKLANIKLM